jgi:ferredoxin
MMTRPRLGEDLCIGRGTCEDICPSVFQVGEDGFSRVIDPDRL